MIYRMLILMLCLGAFLSLKAEIIAVYNHSGNPEDFADMEKFAYTLKDNPGKAFDSRFEWKVSPGGTLTSDLSVPAGYSAYFLSNSEYEYGEEFEMLGESSHFAAEVKTPATSPTGSLPILLSPTLKVSWSRGNLTLRHAFATPGTMKVDVYGAKGERLDHWEWSEQAVGNHARSFKPRNSYQGMLFINWSLGRLTGSQKFFAAPPQHAHLHN